MMYIFSVSLLMFADFTRIGQMGMNDVIRDRVKDMKDFSFTFQGDDTFSAEQVKRLEEIVRRQAEAILSHDKLYTKDVFFSQKAKEAEQNKEKAVKAVELLDEFSEIVEQSDLGDDVFTSVCASTDTVQYYLEKECYTLTIDFLKGDITASDNMKPISLKELKKADEDFWKTSENVRDSLKKYMK